MLKRFFSALLAACLLPVYAFASSATSPQEIQIKETKMVIGENYVVYPQLDGMKDAAIQQKINDDIVLSGDVTSHILNLSTLQNSSWGLKVSCSSYMDDFIFSTVLSAKGKQPNGRDGQSNVALCYDLSTGERVKLSQIFMDEEKAVTALEALAESALEGELSEYVERGQLTPLPKDNFYLDQNGITFYYPSDQFAYVSGYGGACQFFYCELDGLLLSDPMGLPVQMRLIPQKRSAQEQKTLIEAAVKAGQLPCTPVMLGQAMTELVETYRLVRTPDAFPGGRYFVMEAPELREILLISDAMVETYDHSVLEGIQQKRGELYGLVMGKSTRADWEAVLGKPESTIVFSQSMAYDYNLPVGQSDVYHFGDYELRLHGDADGVLRCVQLGK
ncbi:MAG: RsiV family protein [Eubacteriales bacterium]|nr:RsiV family protein [Eubacteriales bacterium]